jgi:hypothetical protein
VLGGSYLAAQRAEQDGYTKQEGVSKVSPREVPNGAREKGHWQS